MNGRENQNQNQACQGQWGKTTTMMRRPSSSSPGEDEPKDGGGGGNGNTPGGRIQTNPESNRNSNFRKITLG